MPRTARRIRARITPGRTVSASVAKGVIIGATIEKGAGSPPYDGETEVYPSGEEQVLHTKGYKLNSDVTVHPVSLEHAYKTVTASGTESITPSSGYTGIGQLDLTVPSGSVSMKKPSLDSASGEVRSQANVSDGWVSGGQYFGSALILDKQAGKTVTPTESAQTAVEQYRWTTGAVTVAAIPSDYVGSAIERRDSSDLIATGNLVNVPAGYYAENEGKAIAEGSATTPATTIAANPTISVGSDGKITASVSASQSVTPTVSVGYVVSGTAGTVSVSGSATEQMTLRTSADLTSSGATVTAPAGYYAESASKAISNGSAYASCIKGTVQNHQVAITPRVTRSAGYITSGSANGTDVTVKASELVSGTLSITANGTEVDCTNYAAVDVAVPLPADGDNLGYGVSTQPLVGTARVGATVLGA